jgi:hypothetical protein
MISFPAPALWQGADEALMIEVGETIFPGCIKRWPAENGLRLWVEGEPTDSAAAKDAVAKFQIVLGVLRSWRSGAGELADERRAGLGQGSIQDEAGNQWVQAGFAMAYGTVGGEIEQLAQSARLGIDDSQDLENALWLQGRPNRTAADFYMIYEFAEKAFGGSKNIRDALGLSTNSQKRLTNSANNLSPRLGGRHAKTRAETAMDLEEQLEYVADLLRRWIGRYSAQAAVRVLCDEAQY